MKDKGIAMARYQKKRKKRRIWGKVLFVMEIFILIMLCGGIFLYAQISRNLDVTQDNDFIISNVQINKEVVENNVAEGYQLVALVGLDNTDGKLVGNSDTMMIACINNETKEVNIVSIYRDTYLRVSEDESGNGMYYKANHAFALDGAEGLLTMLNSNLDLPISDYVTVGFDAVSEVVDKLGGVEISLTHDEIVHMNNYCVSVSESTGKDYVPINPDEEGVHLLNGVQAVSYARIRKTAGNDFKRTQRQRLVITKIVEKVKHANLSTLNDIMDSVFPMVKTSFSKTEIIKMAASLLSYKIGETAGFPFTHYMLQDVEGCYGKDLDCVVPITLESNVKELHAWLFGTQNYEVSQELKSYSDYIVNESGYGDDYIEKARQASIAALPDMGSEADMM